MFQLSKSIALLGLIPMLFSAQSAMAEVPSLSLAFKTSSVTVNPNEDVPIWVTLTVNSGSLNFDTSSSTSPFGLDPDQLPLEGENFSLGIYDVPFGSYSGISKFTYRNCNDEVSTGCDPLIYSFNPGSGPSYWLDSPSSLSMAQGESRDFLVHVLTPENGNATPGSYKIFNVGFGITVTGYDADGTTELRRDVFSVGTCEGGDPSCSFTVNVVPVPEPENLVMLMAGLGLLGIATRRKK